MIVIALKALKACFTKNSFTNIVYFWKYFVSVRVRTSATLIRVYIVPVPVVPFVFLVQAATVSLVNLHSIKNGDNMDQYL